MKNELNAPKSLDADEILTAIEVQQGLIVRRAQDAYSFSHLTIQEYLTARELWTSGPDAWRITIRDHFFDNRWGVVFVLMAGMGRADELLLQMSLHCQHSWQELVQLDPWMAGMNRWCVNSFLASDTAIGRTSQRINAYKAVGLALGLAHAIYLAHYFARYLAKTHDDYFGSAVDSAVALARALESALDLDSALAHELAVKHSRDLPHSKARDLAHTLERALDSVLLNSDVLNAQVATSLQKWQESSGSKRPNNDAPNLRLILDLPDSLPLEPSKLIRLLTALTLIVRCKNAAYRTTSTAWDEVCNRMLTLPTGETDIP